MVTRKNTLLLKRSNIAGNIPTAGQIQLGELALNTSDVKLYASGTSTDSILQIGWDRVSRTGDTMTGTLYAPTISATTISAGFIESIKNITRNFVSDKALGATTAAGGTVTWIEIYKKLIPANTINDLDELAVEGICEALTSVQSKSIGILVNSTDDIATAIEIGSSGNWVAGASRLNLRRELILRGTNLRGISTAFAGTTDEAVSILQVSQNQFLDYTFNPAIDNYVFFAVKGNTSDNFRKTLFEIKITPNLV